MPVLCATSISSLAAAETRSAGATQQWAYSPLIRPRTPAPASASSLQPFNASTNPIDLFIRARLTEHQLAPAPEADPRTLIRRLCFDLIGLPPTPGETAAFCRSASTNRDEAVASLVDRLLASPRYGERWARHWMDVVHFAETHGHDQDRIRTNAWPYRDYLIASFNADKPYPRFVQEQVAGDVLFPEDPQATVALGFVAAGPWDESSLRDIREDTIDRQIGRYLDRDDMVTTVMQSFTSSTVQCARCHDHKFDPVSQRDYYALQAVFAGVDRANRTYDPDPAVHRRRQELLRERKRIERGDRKLLLAVSTQSDVAEWEASLSSNRISWRIAEPQTFVSEGGATLARQSDGSVLASGTRPERDTYIITANSPLTSITAVRLEVLTDDSLPKKGPGRQENGNLHLSEFELWTEATEGRQRSVHGVSRGPEAIDTTSPEGAKEGAFPTDANGSVAPTGLVVEHDSTQGLRPGLFFNAPPGLRLAGLKRTTLFNPSADFSQSGWTVEHAVDGHEKTAWGIYPRVGESHQAVFELKQPLVLTNGSTLVFVLKQLHGEGHLIGRPRFSITDAPLPVRVNLLPAHVAKILGTPRAERTDDQRAELAAFVLRERFTRELAALPKPSLVYAAANDFEPDGGLKPAGAPRAVQMLKRGDITRPLEPAMPGALQCVAMLAARFQLSDEADEGARRAALAHWLTDPENPLTWRSIVNRVWHYHFGRGLVDTPNDFGKMGGTPSHPELLDWLAVWFRDDTRGSLKQLHRLIVTSATYRQESSIYDLRMTIDEASGDSLVNRKSKVVNHDDPENRLLWHMNRTRLDAEQVRDAILQISGCLDLRMGGPSDMQFDLQPGHHVTPKVDYTKFDVSSPEAQRRSVYRFLFRTLPDPLMDALDSPAGDQLTPVRNASVTVQQALALWNNAFVAHYAERFAMRVETQAKTLAEQVTLACELALNRPPTAEEIQDFTVYATKHGLANLCRLIVNSNEFMFVN
jgi:hypothetical protein